MTIELAIIDAVMRGLERIDAQLLLLHTLGRAPTDRAWLLTHSDDVLPALTQAMFAANLQRKLSGEPLAYITGHKAFYGLDLQVDARVLDPRADTETLVDWALELIPLVPLELLARSPVDRVAKQAASFAVLDLGTGSGAIALAIKSQRPAANVTATDASADALAVARANAQRLKLAIEFAQGSWLNAVKNVAPESAEHNGALRRFNLIVSNPPYIAERDTHLDALQHEPLSALASGPDGLDDIRHIIATAQEHLATGGWLLLEHGYDQAPAVRELLTQAGFGQVQSLRDLAGIERCSGGQRQA